MSEYDGVIDYVRLPNNRVYKVGSASGGGGASDGTIPYITAALKSGSTTNFEATFDGVEVKQGLMVGVKFGSNVPANGKLDLNGIGDIPIYYKNAAIAASQVSANYTVLLIYDTVAVTTGRWDLVWSYGYNSTYSTVGLGFAYTTSTTAEATAAKTTATVSSFALNKFGIVAVKFTYGVPASATLNVSGKGAKPIFYQGAAITAGVIEAGDTATFIYDGTNWNLIAIDRVESTDTSPDIYYTTCSTARSTLAKTTATIEGYVLKPQSIVIVQFTNSILANSTLNVSGTGAKPIMYRGSAIIDGIVEPNDTVTFYSSDSYWRIISIDKCGSSATTNAANGFLSTTCATAEATKAKETADVTGYVLKTQSIVAVRFTYAVPAGSTLNVSGTGAKSMLHRGAAITDGIIEAGDTATFIYGGVNWNLISVDKFGASGDFVPFSGGTMTGPLIAANSATSTKAMRNISAGTEEVSTTLSEGDIYIQYI